MAAARVRPTGMLGPSWHGSLIDRQLCFGLGCMIVGSTVPFEDRAVTDIQFQGVQEECPAARVLAAQHDCRKPKPLSDRSVGLDVNRD